MAATRVVIVDDSPDDRALEARLLRGTLDDLEIVEVADAAAWSTVLEAGDFDLVVTDYHLRWTNGLEVLAEVRRRWPERPVILVTGTGTEEVAVAAMKAGAEDYVLKSRTRIDRLPHVVAGALARASGRSLDRTARARLDREIEERAAVSASIGRIHPGESPEATADLVCREIRSTLGLDIVAVEWFLGPEVLVVALESSMPSPIGVSDLLPASRSAYLHERALRGPWIEDWEAADPDDPYVARWRAAGIDIGAYAPILRGGLPVGLLVVATSGRWSIEAIARALPELMEYAAVASALIGPAMSERSAAVAQVAEVRRIVAAGAFHAVFQPIVGLSSKVLAGYEALTRFDDGVSPAIHFANARAAGIGVELELATLGTAVRAAEVLPRWAFVSLNVSAELLFATGSLAPVAATFGRPLVLELTEHEAGVDSDRLLRLVKSFGDNVRLAVDDAGAGYAGLRRVLELRPQFVKLDMELVRNIDRDPAREALIAGMVHFARETDSSLIAEGIEREGERKVLRRLGVSFGQGYLLGRPAPAETWKATPFVGEATAPAG